MRCYMVFGHIHGNTDADYWPLIQANERMLNAGVDVNHFEPVTFEEMEANNLLYKGCLLYTSPSPRDYAASRMPSSA